MEKLSDFQKAFQLLGHGNHLVPNGDTFMCLIYKLWFPLFEEPLISMGVKPRSQPERLFI